MAFWEALLLPRSLSGPARRICRQRSTRHRSLLLLLSEWPGGGRDITTADAPECLDSTRRVWRADVYRHPVRRRHLGGRWRAVDFWDAGEGWQLSITRRSVLSRDFCK